MSSNLTVEQIYAELNPDWWVNTYPQGTSGIICPATMLYFTTKSGNYGASQSSGFIDPANIAAINYTGYIAQLRQEAALSLFAGGCTGNITNIKPQAYNPLPIYFA